MIGHVIKGYAAYVRLNFSAILTHVMIC